MVPVLATKDYRRTTLEPRHRPVVRALAEAFFSPDGEVSGERLDAFVDEVDRYISPASKTLRFGLTAMLAFLLLEAKIPAGKVECTAFHPLGSAKMSRTEDGGVVKPTGETWAVENLFVCDGSVLPTSIGVNSQVPVMSIAMMLARGLAEDFGRYARRA